MVEHVFNDPEKMQNIATQVNLSETVFISKSDKADFKLDFFTPSARVADCGHATVAAFSVLESKNPNLHKTSKEILSVTRKILIEDQKIFMEQPIAKLRALELSEDVVHELIGVKNVKSAVLARHDVGFVLIELSNSKDLKNLSPSMGKISSFSKENDVVGLYTFSRNEELIQSRMFAPLFGINEEAATGMGAGLLSSFIYQTYKENEFMVEQGRFMTPSSPSFLYCKIQEDAEKVIVGGYSNIKKEIEIKV